MKLMPAAHQYEYYGKPRLDLRLCAECSEGIIAFTACMAGVLSHPSWERLARRCGRIFGDDFYLEIMPVDMDEQREVNDHALYLHKKYGFPMIVTNDVHYLEEHQSRYHNF